MPDNPSSSPAPLSDAHLRETLDLVAELVASVSDRVDDQTKALDRMSKTAAEARQAAFAAKAQTDPKAYGDLVGQTISGRVAQHLDDIRHLNGALRQTTLQVDRTLKEASKDRGVEARALRDREWKIHLFWTRTRWFFFASPLILALLVLLLPRFIALHPDGCFLLGGQWRQTPTYHVCSHFGE